MNIEDIPKLVTQVLIGQTQALIDNQLLGIVYVLEKTLYLGK